MARDRYAGYYATARLRQLALRRQGTRHGDLWRGPCLVIDALGREEGCPQLGLPGIGGLFDPAPADLGADQPLANDALLTAVWHLSVVQPRANAARSWTTATWTPKNWRHLRVAAGSGLKPHDAVQRTFTLETLAGNDRKTTGSYYTPSALIDLVLDEVPGPAAGRRREVRDQPGGRRRTAVALTVCDPACGSGHFLVAAARRIATGWRWPAPGT